LAHERTEVKGALLQALIDLGMQFTADAIEHSEVAENGGELVFITPKEYTLAMSESDLKKAAQQAFGKTYRIRVAAGDPVNVTPAASARSGSRDEKLLERVLSDPSVQRFREAFPDARIGPVRDLKE
jgi:hypothetical protein